MFKNKVKKVKKEKVEKKQTIKKQDTKEQKSSKKEKKFFKHIKKNKKIYLTSLIVIVIAIIVFLVVYGINLYLINKEYVKYEEKMETYGFNMLYNNKAVTSYEKVSNLEAVKLVLGTIYNTYDASSIGYQPEGEYEGDEWVKTAEAFGILEENKINKDNINKNISYWDFIKMYMNGRNKKLELKISSTKESKFKNLNSLTQEQKQYINDMAENGIIKNTSKKLDLDKDIIKGQINEIVVNYIEKYNAIVGKNETLVTKKESMPSNSYLYPYIVYSIPNEVYEIEHINENKTGYISPKELYKDKKEYYNQMEYRIVNYYQEILNVNYETIDASTLKTKLEDYLLYNYEDSIFEDYANYVKENKIIVEGTAKVLLPIVYYDGIDFRIRTRLEFKIVNSDTNQNILFGDIKENTDKPVTYKNKEYKVYVDIPMTSLINTISYRTEIKSVINILSDKSDKKDNTF